MKEVEIHLPWYSQFSFPAALSLPLKNFCRVSLSLESIAGIVAGSLITFAVLYYVGVIQPDARYIIPLGGMIIGNSMKAASLGLDRLISELGHQRKRIDNLLALGAGRRQASIGAVRQAVKAAMMPTIDTMKTVGLVHLPGIMTGYIIAGGSPLTAVKFQLAVIYMITGADDVFAVTRYADTWFWINHEDSVSKRMLYFLQLLLSLAETGPAPPSPLVTIPTN